jgi:hypothetical protein
MEQELPLRDVHLPPPVGWWPLAPGWWIALGLALATILLAIYLIRRWRRQTLIKLALAELKAIETGELGAPEKLREISMLLRRIALTAYPRAEIAGLAGEAWLQWLDQPFGQPRFSLGAGRLLLTGPYQRLADADLAGLCALCREWLERLPGKDAEPGSRHR